METNKNNNNIEPSNSNFRELKPEELKSLGKEKLQIYFKQYKKFINKKFQENSERTNKSLENLEKFIDDL